MIQSVRKYHATLWMVLSKFEREHPYLFAFCISLIVLTYIIFRTPSSLVTDADCTDADNLIFLDMDTISAPKRLVKKQVSADEGDESAEAADVERASGISEDENAVDMSFFPGIVPPRPIGRLPKYYPKIAREQNIEAIVNVEMLIGSNGIIKKVAILRVRISKELPEELSRSVKRLFARDARRILLGAQFTPPVVQGKRVPLIMQRPLKFELD